MAIILESFDIESPQHGKPFQVDLVEGLDGVHIEYIEQQWKPVIQRQKNLAILNFFQLSDALRTNDKWNEMLGQFGIQDEHWNWRMKCTVAAASNRKVFALLNAAEVEGVMLLYFGKTSRDAANASPIVYVDYVAIAPWNRAPIQRPQRFRRLGTVLIGAAVAVSKSMGLQGRCGLHSLPQSEGFYHRIGMSDFDLDPAYHSLRYFEFSPQAANQFVENGDL